MVSRPPFGSWVPGNRWDLRDGVEPDPLPRVSVIVAHYEQPAQLDRTLRALRRQRYPAELLEVIVADDGSAVAPDVGEGVRLVRQDDRGFRLSAARNLGVRHATGEVLCFLDADTAPEPDYVRRMSRLPALLPETVTVGRRRHADFAGVGEVDAVEDAGTAHALDEPEWLRDAYRATGDLRHVDDRSYRYVIGATMACSRWMFDEAGGFDETFTAYGGEDWEWTHRAFSHGALLAHVPDAIAWHDGPDWAGRAAGDGAGSGEAEARKNDEMLQLAARIPVPGSRGHAVRAGIPDLIVRLQGSHSAGATFVCVDSVLNAFPHARIVLEDPTAFGPFASDPRIGAVPPDWADTAPISLDIDRPVAFTDARGAVQTLAALRSADHGDLRVHDERGVPFGRAVSLRTRRRRERWGVDEVTECEDAAIPGAVILRAQPGVGAYLGGWARESHLGE